MGRNRKKPVRRRLEKAAETKQAKEKKRFI